MSPSSRIEDAAARSSLVDRALEFARSAHKGQVRWTGAEEMPFVDHPLAVAELLAAEGFDGPVLAAALLHDTVEHADADADELRAEFGDGIAGLVAALTEDAGLEDVEERKEDLRRRVVESGPGARAIFAADKAANVITLREAYALAGEAVDARLPIGLDRKLAIWESDLEALVEAEEGVPIVDRLADELVGLRGQRATARYPGAGAVPADHP